RGQELKMAQGRLCNRDGLILTAMVSYPCAVLVYSYGFGSLLLLPPLVFFSFRSRSLPPLTSLILYKMGLLGLIVMEKLSIRKESSLAKVLGTLLSIVGALVGILNSGYYIVHTWAVIYKGPVYLSMFKPLSILIAAASTTIFLSESIYLGILIGGILISVGFCMVLWGKAKEAKVDILGTIESSPSHEAPLLGN
ncbi:hypothetical protein HID58_086224, partial [Brassica napus]